jgi:hypothetical protein
MAEMRIRTNYRKRALLSGWELTERERAELDYIAPPGNLELWGEHFERFFRYRGNIYDIQEFSRIIGPGENGGAFAHHVTGGSPLLDWGYIQTDSYFSGIVFRYCAWDGGDTQIQVALVTC